MEPVGFAASLLALTSTLIQVSRVIRELRRNHGECPAPLAHLASAVSELERLVAYVKDLDEARLKDQGGLDRTLFEDSKVLLQKCMQDLSEIQQKIDAALPLCGKWYSGIKELQLDMDALKGNPSKIQDTEFDTTVQQASASILQMNDAFAVSFRQLVQLTEQSITKISSTALQTVIKDLVQIFDYMKMLIQRGPSDNSVNRYFEGKLQPLNISTFPTGIVLSHRTAVRTRFATLETSVGRLDLLLKLSQSHKAGHVTSENALESKFLAEVSLLPGANLPQKTQIIFQAILQSNQDERFTSVLRGKPQPRPPAGKKWRDSLQIEKPQAQTAMNMAGPYLVGYNAAMVKYLVNCGADVAAFKPVVFAQAPVLSSPVAIQMSLSAGSHHNRLASESATAIAQAGANFSVANARGVTFATLVLAHSSMQTLRAIFDNAEPFVTPQTRSWTHHGHLCRSALLMAWAFTFLTSRGADPCVTDEDGGTPLHMILSSGKCKYWDLVYGSLVTNRQHGELKDILMLLVPAGAYVFAVDHSGESVSGIAVKHGYSVEWKETLEECRYDVLNVLNHVHGQDDAPTKEVQRSSLKFAEYLEVRKSTLLNLEVGDDERPAFVYPRYYETTVPEYLRGQEVG
ncbi:uncharacterized protein A1O5_12293 [Cladophialophora psammophila CBS 110553]|uniref:Fungal N-terminal domain-containing protein n=1 Tax=Cladophialophora psammophila CBS 110553 TaxID=1182543 RepID=W9VUM1_9EURO|nr:uncharacterized protein A1O5_12293 [Cladophialophora psammophila CBS 110553]EXJ59412.1 hypothetical protein A1O5_12293 [Cladophialophora psammophila CBS 110553]